MPPEILLAQIRDLQEEVATLQVQVRLAQAGYERACEALARGLSENAGMKAWFLAKEKDWLECCTWGLCREAGVRFE